MSALAFPSDLADEGVETVLGNLQDRAGVDGITPAFVYHAARDDLPTCMSKFLHLGMPLRDVVAACTSRPAQLLGIDREVGSLRVGSCADVALVRLRSGRTCRRSSPTGCTREHGHTPAAMRAAAEADATARDRGRLPASGPPTARSPRPSRSSRG